MELNGGEVFWVRVIYWVRREAGGTLWAASDKGLFRFDGTCFKLLPIILADLPVLPTVNSAAMDDRGDVSLTAEANRRWGL